MDTQKLIMDKISSVLAVTDKAQIAELKKHIDSAGRIFVAGAGRSKLVSSFLSMRLVHCGYQVSMVGEIVTPALKQGDLYIVISGSGGTKTLLPTLETASADIADEDFIETTTILAPFDLAVSKVGSNVLVPPEPEITMYKSPCLSAGVTISPTILT